MAGAPIGNQNAAKGRRWANALREALITYEDPERMIQAGQALGRIAQRVVLMALDGDKDVISEIANRLDGRPRQQIDAGVQTTVRIHWPLPPSPLEQALSESAH
jgi:hypothetical protein